MKSIIGFLMILSILEIATTSCPSGCKCVGNSINCSFLGFSDIPQDLPSESVDILDLSKNRIIYLGNNTLLEFSKLFTLDVSYNQIQLVDINAFSMLHELRHVDLSNNKLKFLNPQTFSTNPKLESVSLSGNPLTHLPDNFPFLISISIRSLDLSLCTLNTIYPETFSSLPNLHVLDLSSNSLQEIPPNTLNRLKHLRIVELGNNRWSCRCQMQKLLQWANRRRSNLPAHRPVKCKENGQYRTLWSVTGQDQLCINVSNENPQKPMLHDKIIKIVDNQIKDIYYTIPSEVQKPSDILNPVLTKKYNKSLQLPYDADLEEEYTDNTGMREDSKIRTFSHSGIDYVGKVKEGCDGNMFQSWNASTVLAFIVLPCILGMFVFVLVMVAVGYFKLNKNPQSVNKNYVQLQSLSRQMKQQKGGL